MHSSLPCHTQENHNTRGACRWITEYVAATTPPKLKKELGWLQHSGTNHHNLALLCKKVGSTIVIRLRNCAGGKLGASSCVAAPESKAPFL